MLSFRVPLLFGLLLVLCSCVSDTAGTTAPAPATETAPAAAPETPLDVTDRTYVPGERIGAITAAMTVEDVRKIYGADQLVATILNGPEGMTYEGFHLFPGTDDQLNISLDEDGFAADTGNKGSHWASAGYGVRVGTSLAELERLNGGPFIFTGFDWDYGGAVTDWLGGELEGHHLRLGYNNYFFDVEDKAFLDYAIGDQSVRSDGPLLRDKGIAVDRIFMSGRQ